MAADDYKKDRPQPAMRPKQVAEALYDEKFSLAGAKQYVDDINTPNRINVSESISPDHFNAYFISKCIDHQLDPLSLTLKNYLHEYLPEYLDFTYGGSQFFNKSQYQDLEDNNKLEVITEHLFEFWCNHQFSSNPISFPDEAKYDIEMAQRIIEQAKYLDSSIETKLDSLSCNLRKLNGDDKIFEKIFNFVEVNKSTLLKAFQYAEEMHDAKSLEQYANEDNVINRKANFDEESIAIYNKTVQILDKIYEGKNLIPEDKDFLSANGEKCFNQIEGLLIKLATKKDMADPMQILTQGPNALQEMEAHATIIAKIIGSIRAINAYLKNDRELNS